MKLTLFIITAFAAVAMQPIVVAQKKLALIVAVGNYPPGGRWRNLSSENDLHYVKASLINNGFDEKNIDTLKNASATKDAIVKALDELYERAGNGDIVYFQFSGHGQQIQDDNGDEADGYDEALVPYDAEAMYDPVTYHGEKHLRDDLLGEKLAKIRRKIGTQGSLVVLIDACHSGTATRGGEFSIVRGTEIPFQQPGYKANVKIDLTQQGFFEGEKNGMGNMIVISASSANQVNYETKDQDQKGVGSLSYGFAKALNDLGEAATYQLLFEKIKSKIQADHPTQLPLIEGDITQQVFSGNYKPKEELHMVQTRYTDSTFMVNAGLLNNVSKGTKVQIFVVGAANPYCEGVLTQVNSFQSMCRSSKPLNKGEAYHVKIETMNYGEFAASLFIQTHQSNAKQAAALEQQLKNLVKPYQYLSLSNNADMMLDIQPSTQGGYTVSLVESGDSVHYTRFVPAKDTLSAADWKYMLDGIKRSIRVKYLRSIADGGSFAKDIKFEVVPVKKNDNPSELIMHPGDEFAIKITNTGTDELYYTIIDMLPDNDVKVLIPEDNREPQDYVIRPKSEIPITGITVDAGTPNGKEFFKIIVTRTPMDLRSILNRTRSRSAAGMQSLEQMVDDLFKDGNAQTATRSSIGTVKVEEVGIVTCGFTIKN